METVTVSRRVDAAPERVADVVTDTGSFVAAGGFTDVTVDGDVVHIKNQVGIATLELTLELLEDDEAVLAFEQREGLFREMETRYEAEPVDGGTRVVATTEFALGGSRVGDLLDSWVVRRQRVKELEAQLDYLEERLADA